MGVDANRRPRDFPATGQFAADAHFLNRGGRGFASHDTPDGAAAFAAPGAFKRCHFAVFRAESVSVTSTRLAGGDWRWRLCSIEGAILVEAGGYASEKHCREAVAILQASAARASVA